MRRFCWTRFLTTDLNSSTPNGLLWFRNSDCEKDQDKKYRKSPDRKSPPNPCLHLIKLSKIAAGTVMIDFFHKKPFFPFYTFWLKGRISIEIIETGWCLVFYHVENLHFLTSSRVYSSSTNGKSFSFDLSIVNLWQAFAPLFVGCDDVVS